ncbi:hypothetical protein ABZY45_06165 [Streptomyces sp. NPDC006516]|uniref:hypothetical protein n=1 Tax=Streptomyces sp. NPDC006516 TaxID=3154309 RepID=UPI0033A8F3EC
MNPTPGPVRAGPSDLALPLALVVELALSAPAADAPRPPEIGSGTSRGRRAARRRAPAVRG